ncbi:hypothetical protein L1987_70221 [Smallanthus sonchifolius]|uniref:Uncharacterized protein n=1 Tax=Smallanthus sonchifolius TaxID=185202 RepID=A0ACB9ANZ7_9ASTR|nr:hypothetical protein L1987_70221 [Smallanthus sonchifolius]
MSSGDWMCAACQHLNFKKRDACQRCHCPKFARPDEVSSYGMNRTEILAGDWYCATFNCGTHNYASRTACYICGALRDYSAMMASSNAYGYDASIVPCWKTGDWICNRFPLAPFSGDFARQLMIKDPLGQSHAVFIGTA